MNEIEYTNSLFEQPWWLDIVASKQWHEKYAYNKNNEVIGRMAYVLDNDKVFMPRSTQTLGIWIDPRYSNDYGKQKEIINELIKELSDYKYVNIRLSPENDYVLPFRWKGFRIEPQFTYRISDLTDCDSIYNSFNKTAKKNIKYARNKVAIVDEKDPYVMWEILNKTFEAQNRNNPMSESLVCNIITKCLENNHGKYLVARDQDNNVHSSAFFVYDKNACYYLIGGSNSEYRSSGSQSLIIWEGIQFASQHSNVFDFEGSMVEGIENFFRQFGGKCTPYYIVCKQPLVKDIVWLITPKIKKMIGYKV